MDKAFAPLGDTQATYAAVTKKIIENSDQREYLAENTYRIAFERHQWAVKGDRLDDIYRGTLLVQKRPRTISVSTYARTEEKNERI